MRDTSDAKEAGECADPAGATEDLEWLDEFTFRWVEIFKKSATTVVLLRIVREHGALPS